MHYDRKFKENAVKLSYQRDNLNDLARELGIRTELVYRWRREFNVAGPCVERGTVGRMPLPRVFQELQSLNTSNCGIIKNEDTLLLTTSQ